MPEIKQAWSDEGLPKPLSSEFAPNGVAVAMLMFTRGAEHNDPKNPDPKGCTNDTHMENIDSKPESPSENMSGWLSYIHPVSVQLK